YSELLEELTYRRIAFQIEPGKQHAILGEKIADPKSIARVTRSDHAQPGEIGRLSHHLPARDECLQDEIAQLRILIQNLTQRRVRDFVDFAFGPGDAADHLRVAGQMPDVAG